MNQPRSHGPLALALVATAMGLLAGCGDYSSDYRPPEDGRARVLWNGNGVFPGMPNGGVSTECLRAMDEAQERPEAYFAGRPSHRGGVRVYWVPHVYVGPVVPIVRPIGHSHVRRYATPTSSGGGSSFLGGLGKGGGGDGGDAGKAIAVVAAVVVLLALPAVTLGLVAGRPEPEQAVALSIDQVNAYNDLARYPGTPCSPEANSGGPQ